MIIKCFVYRKKNSKLPVISFDKLPLEQVSSKRAFTGTKVKIETLKRAFGIELATSSSTKDVNDYITDNIYNTPKWGKYHTIYKIVHSEIIPNIEYLAYQYYLEVDLHGTIDFEIEKSNIIYFIMSELTGKQVQTYNGLNNPIVEMKKIYPNACAI